jgi:hypothetical protein
MQPGGREYLSSEYEKEDDPTAMVISTAAFASSVGLGAFLAYKYNPGKHVLYAAVVLARLPLLSSAFTYYLQPFAPHSNLLLTGMLELTMRYTASVGDYFLNLWNSNWIRSSFALGAITRLIFFNIRDELVLTLTQSPEREKKLEKTVAKTKPSMTATMMNLMACLMSPANAVYFCSWNAGWEIASCLYSAFYAASRI